MIDSWQRLLDGEAEQWRLLLREEFNMDEEKILYKAERDTAKAAISSMNDGNAMDYLEALEKIAEAGYNLWVQMGQPRQKEMEGDLYDALAVVDFMHDEIEEEQGNDI
jgi:hypothetical protein